VEEECHSQISRMPLLLRGKSNEKRSKILYISGGNMKSRTLVWITTITLLLGLAIPVGMATQGQN